MKCILCMGTAWTVPGLPPCGGSGLKSYGIMEMCRTGLVSPSMRREWIEMESSDVEGIHDFVSLHAEGVD